MIKDKDRSGWFGASDTDFVIAKNHNSKSYQKWWLQKIGLDKSDFTNTAMVAGTNKEHQILNYLDIPEKDKQVKIKKLRLRVNLDGNSIDTIYEVKTHKYTGKPFNVPIKYKRQVWVQMFATGLRKAYIVAYAMKEEDYKNFFLPIDKTRLELIPIEYDEKFITQTYLPALERLKGSMNKGEYP